MTCARSQPHLRFLDVDMYNVCMYVYMYVTGSLDTNFIIFNTFLGTLIFLCNFEFRNFPV